MTPSWPTTVDMSVRQMFVTSNDAVGSAVVVMDENVSASCVGNIRTAAECHANIRWVLGGRTVDERRGRAMALTRDSLELARKASGHWERVNDDPAGRDAAASLRGGIDNTRADLQDLASRRKVTIPKRLSNTELFDRYLPVGYFMFALLSNVGALPLPFPYFYVDPATGNLNRGYKGLDVERSYFVTQASQIQLETCRLVAPVCGWSHYEELLSDFEERLSPLAQAADRRLRKRRDPNGTCMGQ